MLAAAAQVDDGAHALRLQSRDLMRRGLRRAPQLLRDAVLVEVEKPEDAVIRQEHVRPTRARVEPPSSGRSQRAIRAIRRA